MNHCHDCNSDYEQPGTCNCFAPGGVRFVQVLPLPPQPETTLTRAPRCPTCKSEGPCGCPSFIVTWVSLGGALAGAENRQGM